MDGNDDDDVMSVTFYYVIIIFFCLSFYAVAVIIAQPFHVETFMPATISMLLPRQLPRLIPFCYGGSILVTYHTW